jgi:hypothetical protein
MPFLNSIFSCSSKDEKKANTSHSNIRFRLGKVESKINLLEQRFFLDTNRLEEKIDTKFEMLTIKLDNLIMILNNNK